MKKYRETTSNKTQNDLEKEKVDVTSSPEHPFFKYFFGGIAIILFILMLFNAKSTGSGGDCLWYETNGEYILKYYIEGDTSCWDYSKVTYHNMTPIAKIKWYAGGGFDIIPADNLP